MSLPILRKSWLFGVNNRITFVSLNDTSARILFGIKNFLVVTCGYTVKYTCDGTTGPSSSSDHTDRWSTFSNASTRGAGTGNAQSFAVLTDGNGVDILLTYQGATDDFWKMSFSNGGNFTPAGTSNQQPTATDETIVMPNTGMSGAAPSSGLTSGDRVWHIMASTDKKLFRFFIYRFSTMIAMMGVELVTSAVTAIGWSPAVVAFATNQSAPTSITNGHLLADGSSSAGQGGWARVSATNGVGGGGGFILNGSDSTNVTAENNVDLQAGAPISPVAFYSNTANVRGKLGDRIDVYYPYSTGVNQGDIFGSAQWAYFGTGIWPWNGGPVVIS